MNNPFHIYNQSVPIINNTDWASVAKQWATLRADVNIPQHIHHQHNYHQLPPPPPPSPPMDLPAQYQQERYHNYQPIVHQEFINPPNHNLPISPTANNSYQSPAYTFYEDIPAQPVKSSFETFDYNHGNRPYEYYNNIETYQPPVTTPVTYSQNMWTLPPPDHPDIARSNFTPEVFAAPQESIIPPKLFPIVNDFNVNAVVSCPQPVALLLNKPTHLLKHVEPKISIESRFDNDYVAARPTKGLPAWIIDDMKKMKEKERKKTYHSMDAYKDNPVYSRRDDEGDVVMEDVSRESASNEYSNMSGKNVRKHQIEYSSPTDTDIIIDVSPKPDDILVDKINYSSKSLTELIDMLDDTELAALKVNFIRDSLTGVMKEITDDMIFATVKSTFSRELTKGKKTHKHKGKSDSLDSTATGHQKDVICQLLGLDVYESDKDDNESSQETQSDSKLHQLESSIKEKSSSHKKQSVGNEECDIKSSRTKSSKDKSGADLKDKTSLSNEKTTLSKRRHRSKSRDNGRSKDKHKSHKKSKKHSNSNDLKDESRKSDHHEKSSSSRKKI